MNITSIKLKDRRITELGMVSFVVSCIWELDGFPGVTKKITEKQLSEAATEIVKARKYAFENGSSMLDLDVVEISSLRDLCGIVVDVLDEYGDLETIMVINKDAAYKRLNNL